MELESGIYTIRAVWTNKAGELDVDYLEEYLKNSEDFHKTIKRIKTYMASDAVEGTLKVTCKYLRPLTIKKVSDYLE